MVATTVVPHIEVVLSTVGKTGERVGGTRGVVGGTGAGGETMRPPLNDKTGNVGRVGVGP